MACEPWSNSQGEGMIVPAGILRRAAHNSCILGACATLVWCLLFMLLVLGVWFAGREQPADAVANEDDNDAQPASRGDECDRAG